MWTGHITQVEGDRLAINALGGQVAAPQPEQPRRAGDEVRLVIRPEAIMLNADRGDFAATVRRATYFGSVIEYELEVAGQHLIAVESDVQRAQVLGEGELIHIGFFADSLYCLAR